MKAMHLPKFSVGRKSKKMEEGDQYPEEKN